MSVGTTEPATELQQEVAGHIVELMVLTAWADGKVEGSEALSIQQQVTAHPLLQQVRNLSGLAKKTRARMIEVGLETALREVAARVVRRPDRELAYQCCVRVMGADGDLQSEEASVLANLQQAFEFSPMDVKRLLVTASRVATQ
jgi:tellurite resistance protein